MTEANMLIEDVASTDTSKIIKQVSVSGQLDESNIDEKAQAIYQLITQYPKGLNVIFDFDKLEYMNSKSIGYLTDWYGKVTEGGGHIVIIKAKPNIIDILSVIGLTQLIPMFSSVDEAKFSLLNPTPAPAPASAPVAAPATVVTPVTPVASPASVTPEVAPAATPEIAPAATPVAVTQPAVILAVEPAPVVVVATPASVPTPAPAPETPSVPVPVVLPAPTPAPAAAAEAPVTPPVQG